MDIQVLIKTMTLCNVLNGFWRHLHNCGRNFLLLKSFEMPVVLQFGCQGKLFSTNLTENL